MINHNDKKPCLLLFNDIHISKEHIPEFVKNWDEALSVCRKYGIKEIALGGDLFHSRVSQTLDVLLAVQDALLKVAACGLRITIAEGNHCKTDQEALRGYSHIFNPYAGVTVVDDFLTLDNPAWDFVLHMMSYFPERGSFTSRLQALTAGSLAAGKRNYLYIHQGINGALAAPAGDELPTQIFEPYDKVFVGHYHNRSVVQGTRIEYIGSARQFNFGEDIHKGYTVLYTDGSYDFIQNEANLRYHVIEIPATKVDVHLLDRIDEMLSDERCRIKVRVTGSSTDTIDKKKILDAGASKVELVCADAEQIAAPEEGVLEKFDALRIRQSYEEFCGQRSIEDVALGLSYLSKIEAPCGI